MLEWRYPRQEQTYDDRREVQDQKTSRRGLLQQKIASMHELNLNFISLLAEKTCTNGNKIPMSQTFDEERGTKMMPHSNGHRPVGSNHEHNLHPVHGGNRAALEREILSELVELLVRHSLGLVIVEGLYEPQSQKGQYGKPMCSKSGKQMVMSKCSDKWLR
jgi:hypothetical protein